jgi:hypothetical protein
MYILSFWPTVDVYKVVAGRTGKERIREREGGGRVMLE